MSRRLRVQNPQARRGPSSIRRHVLAANIERPVPIYPRAVGKNLLPHVHRVAALLKRWLLGTHQGSVAPGRLQSYLDEYVFRFNRRTAKYRGLLFNAFLAQIVTAGPIDRQSL